MHVQTALPGKMQSIVIVCWAVPPSHGKYSVWLYLYFQLCDTFDTQTRQFLAIVCLAHHQQPLAVFLLSRWSLTQEDFVKAYAKHIFLLIHVHVCRGLCS